MNQRYAAERLYQNAERQLRIARDHPPEDRGPFVAAAASGFDQTLTYTLESLKKFDSLQNPVAFREMTYLAFQAASRLTQLHFSARHFDTCIGILNNLVATVPLHQSQVMTTTLNLGQALQASGAWDSAVTVYDGAIQEFYPPVDDSGQVVFSLFNVPLHMFTVVKSLGDTAATQERYNQAVQFYTGLVEGFPNSRVAIAAHAALARLYDDTGQWAKVVEQLEAIQDHDPEQHPDIRLRIGDIYALELARPEQALSVYNEVLDYVGTEDTLRRPMALFKIALVKLEQGKYNEGREILIDLKRNHESFYAVMPSAQFAMARSFELQGKWNRAETEYKYLIEKYRGSDEAMSTYMYLADRFREQGRTEQADRWYGLAEENYDQMAARGSGSMMEARALVYKADLYNRQDKLPQSAEILISIFEKFPNTDAGRQALLKASAIYRTRLGDTKRAEELLERLRTTLVQIENDWEI